MATGNEVRNKDADQVGKAFELAKRAVDPLDHEQKTRTIRALADLFNLDMEY